MKYRNEINEIFRLIIGDDVSEEVFQVLKQDILNVYGVTMDDLDEKFRVSVENGYSIKFQMRLLKDLIEANNRI